jgi:hypothetical protein
MFIFGRYVRETSCKHFLLKVVLKILIVGVQYAGQGMDQEKVKKSAMTPHFSLSLAFAHREERLGEKNEPAIISAKGDGALSQFQRQLKKCGLLHCSNLLTKRCTVRSPNL